MTQLFMPWWKRVGPTVWALSAGLWMLGGGLTWLGIVGDRDGWWDSRPFLTNLFSGVVGACFGIPIAIVFVGEISRRQHGRADREDANMSLRRRYYSLIQSVRSLQLEQAVLALQEPLLPPRPLATHFDEVRSAWAKFANDAVLTRALDLHDHLPNELAKVEKVLNEAPAMTAHEVLDLLKRLDDPLRRAGGGLVTAEQLGDRLAPIVIGTVRS